MQNGLIHIYYGNGKGKTSSAIGLCIRALGADLKVLFVQFLKDNNSSELKILREIKKNLVILEAEPNNNFFHLMTENEKTKTKNNTYSLFISAINNAINQNFDVLILDELLDAIELGILKKNEIVKLIKEKPKNLEIVITGHTETIELNEIADYLTHFNSKKHPYDKGIKARKGIEL